MSTPAKPQFYYIKVGFKGVKIIYACFRETHVTVLKEILQWGPSNEQPQHI